MAGVGCWPYQWRGPLDQAQRINRNTARAGTAVSRILGAFALLLLFCGSSQAQSVALAWNPNTESNLAGYIVSYGTASGVYSNNFTVGTTTTTYTVTGL